MSASMPAPAWITWRRFLERTAAISKGVAVLLVTAISLRFSIVSIEHAFAISRGNFAEKPVRHADKLPIVPAPPPNSTSAKAAPAPPPSPATPTGQPRRVTLGVNAGPPRSDVYVNGRKVGQTPFLGDTSCKTGQEIRIEIVPQKGAPLTYVRGCAGGALEISGPPP